MDSRRPSKAPLRLPPRTHRISPTSPTSPEEAWQEEESLEVYRRKTTQRPPADGPAEIVRFVKRRPKSTDEVFETTPPRRDTRREIILLEPVQFRDESPETLYDDYSLYRMEEYVDASSEMHPRDKQPLYYTVEKVSKEHDTHDVREAEEAEMVDECLSPAKEVETLALQLEEEGHRTAELPSSRENLIGTPTPFALCSYTPPVAVGDIEDRDSDGGRSEKECSQCGRNGSRRETPVLDRTVYYEREIVQDGRTPDMERGDSRAPSRQTYLVDGEIAQANRRVDSILREHAAARSPQPSVRSLPPVKEEDDEERSSFEEQTWYKRMLKERSEYEEEPKPFAERKEPFKMQHPVISRKSRSPTHITDYQKYERMTCGPPSRPLSAARSTRSASGRSGYSPCPHRSTPPDYAKASTQERRAVRDVPILLERPPPLHHEVPRARQSPVQKTHAQSERPTTDSRLPPIHETITTEKFERIERVRRRFPATAV